MRIEYELTKDDYFRFFKYYYKESKRIKKRKLYICIGLAICTLLNTIANGQFTGETLFRMIFELAFVLVAFPFVYKLIAKAVLSKEIKRNKKYGQAISLIGLLTIIINNGSIQLEDKKYKNILTSDFIENVKIYDNIIVLYKSSDYAYLLPRRYLTKENENELRKIFQNKISA